MASNILEIDNPLYMMNEEYIMKALEAQKFKSENLAGITVVTKNELPIKIYIKFQSTKAKQEFLFKYMDQSLVGKTS